MPPLDVPSFLWGIFSVCLSLGLMELLRRNEKRKQIKNREKMDALWKKAEPFFESVYPRVDALFQEEARPRVWVSKRMEKDGRASIVVEARDPYSAFELDAIFNKEER